MRQLTALLLILTASLSTHAQLVPKDAVPEKVADGYKFTEGPALGPDGCIYFTDIPAELILKFDPETNKTETFLEKTGRANGLMFYKGRLHACEHGNRRVSSGVVDGEVMLSTEVSQYKKKKLNSPNDLTIDQAGHIYFTDPRYGNRDDMEMEIEGVYFQDMEPAERKEYAIDEKGKLVVAITPVTKPLVRIDAELVRPNGIVLSPDESILYVADNGANYIYAYDIESPGKVKNKRVFGRINDGKGGGSDGMCVDKQGRLYATGHGKVWVFEPTGQLVATIPVGRQTTNVTFGADGKTLYITANKGLYRIKLDTNAPLEHAAKE
jgi:gluconolactonase